ncbi:MAG: PAS domain S-box protein [Nitrospirae bacterium]|nr:PAS domain S-box protein [Nitrospirota bacterium]
MDTDRSGITTIKEREIKLERSNRLHAFINKVNESIIRSDDPEKIYARLCQFAIEDAKLSMACVCREEPGSGRMTPMAYQGFNTILMGSLPHAEDRTDDLCCPVNSALSAGKTFVCNEGATKACSFPLSSGSVRPHYHSCAAFPIVLHNFTIGAIWLFSREHAYFGCDEVSILESLARNLSFALDAREQERKRRDTESALWLAEKRYRSIVENVSEGIYQTTRDGQVLMANPALAHMLGFSSPVEMITSITSIRKQLYAEPARRDELVRLMDKEGAVNNFECRLIRKEGAVITVLLNMRSVRNDEGTLLYFEGSARNITDRKRAFEALKTAKEEWELTFNAVPDLIMIVDQNHRIQHVNRALLLRLDLKPENIIGKHCYEYMHSSLNPPVFCPHNRIMHEGKSFEGEIYDERLKGHFLLTISPLPGTDGKVRGTVHVFRDISDRKKVEAAVRESEYLYRTLFENASEGILYLSSDGSIAAVNNSFAKMHGYTRDEMLKMNLRDLDTPETSRLAPERLERITAGEVLQFEVEHYHKRGHTVLLDVATCLITVGDEKLVVGFHRDITDRRRAEQEAKIMQSRLIHADKMNSLGMLVSSVAHEVNNPNNFIMFNSSILADAWKDIQVILDDYRQKHGDYRLAGLPYAEMSDAIPRLFAGISDGAQRIKGIVEKLRDFARNDRGSLDAAVDMSKVVQDAVMILENQIKKHTDYFDITVGEGIPAVRGNHQQLEQVMINLIMNALQSLRDRSARVEIAIHPDVIGDMIEVRVRDEGCGISREVLEKITEPFFTTRLDSGGTGLGLSISKSIIDDHRGTLEFISEPNGGATAIVRLPAEPKP